MDLMEVKPSLMPTHAEATISIGNSPSRAAFGKTLL